MAIGGGFLLYWFVTGKLPAFAFAVKTGAVPNIQNPNSTLNTSAPSTAGATINDISGLGSAIGGLLGTSSSVGSVVGQTGVGGVAGGVL